MKTILMIISAVLVLSSCASAPKSTRTPNVDFPAYTIAAIGTDTSGSNIVLMDMHMQIQNVLLASGFDVIVDTRIGDLTPEERTRLFIVEFSITSGSNGSICLIYFTDHISGNLIATFRGASHLGFSIDGDRRRAIDMAVREMANVLQNNRGS